MSVNKYFPYLIVDDKRYSIFIFLLKIDRPTNILTVTSFPESTFLVLKNIPNIQTLPGHPEGKQTIQDNIFPEELLEYLDG